MFKLFNKNHLSALLALLSINTINPLVADDFCCPCKPNRFYVGAFGGENYSNHTKLIQRGTAFFTEAEGGPLAVDARGHARKTSSGFGGVQIGYEWTQSPLYRGCSNWSLTPAAELEAFFYSHKKRGALINPTARLPEHDFRVSLPMDVQVYLINGVVSLNHCRLGRFAPYVGGGIGAAHLSIRRADSLQVSPPEVGVNHFDSDRSDAAWAFTAQAKVGLRYNICDRVHIYGEYRYSYVNSSRYLLGSTIAPGHAPTSTWDVDVRNMSYNAFAFGIQFDL